MTMIHCTFQDVRVGTVVLRAYAISRNVGQPEITYSLIDTAGGQDFRIDPTSGEIQTNATLDYTRTDVYLVCRFVSLGFEYIIVISTTVGKYL